MISRRIQALSASALVVALAVAGGCGDSASDSTVVASIEDRALTRSDLDRRLPFGDNTVPQRVADTVAEWLTVQAMGLHAVAEGLGPTEADLDEADTLVPEARSDVQEALRPSIVETAALSLSLGRWATAEAEARGEPTPADFLCSSHILTETESDAEVVLERLAAGEDFAELAVELSTGPSGPSGGDLGCGPRGRFVPAFDDAAFAAASGDFVGPVESEFGWHVIEVGSVGPATVENHPRADPAQLEALRLQSLQVASELVIGEFETEALAALADSVVLDASIGEFDPLTFAITAP